MGGKVTLVGAGPGDPGLLTLKGREALAAADVVVTGEGRMDSQTVMGKVPSGVAAAAKRHGALVVALAGCVTPEAGSCNRCGIDAFFPILRAPCTEQEAMETARASQNLRDAAEQVFRLVGTAHGEVAAGTARGGVAGGTC